MSNSKLSQAFKNRENVWSERFLTIARRANQSLHQSQESVNLLHDLFTEMANDVRKRKLSLETVKNYCYELLNYCDYTLDFRDWPQWAEMILSQIENFDKIWLLYGLGRFHEENGQFEQSIKDHEEGLSLCEQIDNEKSMLSWKGKHLTGKGITLLRMNKFREAEEILENAIGLFKIQQDPYREAFALTELGSCYIRHEKYALAIVKYEEAKILLKSIHNEFDLGGRTLYSVGIAYVLAHRFQDAQSAFQESQRLCEKTRNYHFFAFSFYGMAWVHYHLTQFDLAKEEIKQALDFFEAAGRIDRERVSVVFPEAKGTLCIFAGALYTKTKEFVIALDYLLQAENLAKTLDDSSYQMLHILANKARVYELSENFSKAEQAFLDLVKQGRIHHSPLTCGDGGVHLIRIYRKRHAQLREWLYLFRQLGLYGIYGTIGGLLTRWQRRLNLLKLKK